MKTLFIDCNPQFEKVFRKVHRADDPAVTVNNQPFQASDLPRLLDGYDICIDDHSYMPTELVAQCDALKHIVFLGTGASSYMNVAELEARGVGVHTIKGYGDIAVAEHTVALMFSAGRDIARMDRQIRAGTWLTREGVQLNGKTLGIIGLGGIGREVMRIGRGLGMEVIAWNRTPLPGESLVALDELLARSDVITLHLALNDETRGFLGAAQVTRILRASSGWAPSESTLLRLFHRRELMGPAAGDAPVVFGRFEAAAPNERWVGDALYGPRIGGRKTYLFAFLDDHSRLAVGYRPGSPRTPCASRLRCNRRWRRGACPPVATWTTVRPTWMRGWRGRAAS